MKNNRNSSRGMIKFSSFLKVLLLIILAMIIIVGSTLATIVLGIFKSAPVINPSEYRTILGETSKIYANNDELVQNLVDDEFSEFVPINQMPDYLKNAIVAIEDERFYNHNAVDFRRVAGAIVYNLKTKSMGQGASTITMQLAKNLYTSSKKSFARKITDVYYAYQLEQELNKTQILEAYLNSVGFSKGTVGVGAAAKTFFNKNVSELSLAESALLAGVTNLPEKYTPYNTANISLDDNFDNIQVVLLPKQSDEENSEDIINISEKLLEHGKIDNYELIQIKNNLIVPTKAIFNEDSKIRQKKVLTKMLEQGYISQDEYNSAINEQIVINIGRRNIGGISSFYTDVVQKEAKDILMDLGYSKEQAQNKLFNGGLKIYTAMDLEIQKHLEKTVANSKFYAGSFEDKNGTIQPQVASVIIDQKTHEVKALVGGRDVSGGQILNRAIIPRQPGSSIKPISVYLTAFNNGATAGDVYLDSPLPNKYFGTASKIRNVGNYYRGWTTIRHLLRYSSNVGTVQVARDISVDKDAKINTRSTYSKSYDDDKSFTTVMNTLKDVGVTSVVTPEENPTWNDMNFSALALGGMTHGISPLEMAGAFTTLANEGKYATPHLVTEIVSNTGEVIYKYKADEKEITSKQNAYILTDLLKDVVRYGTGRNANFAGMQVAGKTGTSTGTRNERKDVWFVGYTPKYTCSVWIGNDKNQALSFGSDRAALIWKEIMRPIHNDSDESEFKEPDGIYTKYVNGRRELFADGTKPNFTNKLYWRSERTSTRKKSDSDEKKSNNNNNDNNNSKSQKNNTSSSKNNSNSN